ncbi:MAG: tripartite tricarboxylate transporter substrate binding protein [Acetobacteraceae bacterium]|nr:tripartite tricarboxylate transporter substrate binding protein [Acetobacteraceae bacterium]
MNRRSFLAGSALATAAGASPSTAGAQAAWTPDRPIRLVVPFAPGGSTDTAARIVGQALGQRLGQTVVVENRPGAGGNIAAEHVARSAPDGHTLLLTTSSITATNVWLYRSLSYHPLRDFTPLSQVSFIPNLVVVHPDVPARTLPEFITYAKANPGKLNYGSAGAGTSLHLVATMFCTRAGIQMEHVPYRGGAPAAMDLLSNKIQLIASPMVEVLNYVEAGQLRPLAVSTAQRSPRLPNVPTIAETLPGFEVALWNGIKGPAGLPAPVKARLGAEIAAAVRSEEVSSRFLEQGTQPVGSTPEEFARFIEAEIPKWGELVRIAGVTPD